MRVQGVTGAGDVGKALRMPDVAGASGARRVGPRAVI